MSYLSIIAFIFLTIIVIAIAILLTISIDNLARLPDSNDPVKNLIIANVISLGSFIIIFLIFLIAVGLIGAILAYYYSRLNMEGNLVFYTMIVFIFFTFGVLFLEYYTYTELRLYNPPSDVQSILIKSIDYFLWAIILTVILLILSFITAFFI